MISREELKALIDQVPESSLETVKGMLEYQISPPPPEPDVDRMLERHEEYRRRVEEHFRKTRKPATLGGGVGGGGFARMHGDVAVGRYSFGYWDENAFVEQTLQSFDGQEIEIMERFSVSPDHTKLFCSLELSSGGHTKSHADEFPLL
jgi:hypothetical protein